MPSQLNINSKITAMNDIFQLISSKEIEKIVKAFARKYSGNCEMLQDDLVQEGNLLLYKAAKVYDPQRCDRFAGFACYVLNQALPKVAKRMTRVLGGPDVIETLEKGTVYEAASHVIDCSPSPFETYELTDSRRAIRQAVKLLPRNERIAVSLYYGLDGFCERPYCSIAEELGCSVEGARKTCNRALNKLRVYFGVPNYRLCA